MKKILPLLTVFIIIAIIVVVFVSMSNEKKMVVIHEGNHTQEPVAVVPHHFQDTQCGMTLKNEKHSAQVALPSGKTWFFDDIGCLGLWIQDKPFKDSAKIWVYSNDTHEFINARTATYSRTDATPMRYGFGAYAKKAANNISYEEVLLKVLRGETLMNPYVKKELLGQ